jgi:hypothetical protein
LLGRLLHARRFHDTPSGALVLSPFIEDAAAVFRRRVALDTGHQKLSRLFAAAHMLARLRINAAVTDDAARLATDLPGSALVGRVSHPLDDFSEFR